MRITESLMFEFITSLKCSREIKDNDLKVILFDLVSDFSFKDKLERNELKVNIKDAELDLTTYDWVCNRRDFKYVFKFDDIDCTLLKMDPKTNKVLKSYSLSDLWLKFYAEHVVSPYNLLTAITKKLADIDRDERILLAEKNKLLEMKSIAEHGSRKSKTNKANKVNTSKPIPLQPQTKDLNKNYSKSEAEEKVNEFKLKYELMFGKGKLEELEKIAGGKITIREVLLYDKVIGEYRNRIKVENDKKYNDDI